MREIKDPYKIFSPNNEPNFVIIAGSEKVFVNGSKLLPKG